MSSPSDALVGCIVGQALGDALGFVVEAEPPEVAEEYVRGCLLAGRAGERTPRGFGFGQYTDDTQLARELLRSFAESAGWSPAAFAIRLSDLFRDGLDIGAGPGTRAAAGRLLHGVPWTESGTPAPYAGNGSAMRAGPLGLLFPGKPDEMQRAVREQSRITHLDPRSAAGAAAVAGAVALASESGPIVREEFLERLADWTAPEDASMADAIRGLHEWASLAPDAAAQHLHRAGLDPAHTGAWMGISAFVVPSVLWSLYAFLRSPDDYWTTVCTAIRVGGDTDTMAAMAGAVSGARLGVAAMPEPLVQVLNDRGTWRAKELAQVARDCARVLTSSGRVL
ncbi:MAG TPA: ADP-ribosylglycohydrolase family protein [Gemmatimonadales bacterium]|jgi:ADP-ribosylglycohydrolase|nr:ADP-ribosylglycohydrolase family protein [Gemmatimonadales bacterium]